jgi:hypothetical protein
MNESVVKVELIKAIKELEESGDIVVVNPIENAVADKLFNTVQNVSPNMLSNIELGGIINALNAHKLGFGLGEEDFQTVIGLTKEELQMAVNKLGVPE